jgi:hypothetical protein
MAMANSYPIFSPWQIMSRRIAEAVEMDDKIRSVEAKLAGL